MSGSVIEWLNSPAGEQWSRIAHAGGSVLPEDPPGSLWSPDGPASGSDPCGAGPLQIQSGSSEGTAVP